VASSSTSPCWTHAAEHRYGLGLWWICGKNWLENWALGRNIQLNIQLNIHDYGMMIYLMVGLPMFSGWFTTPWFTKKCLVIFTTMMIPAR
jgi:hypothetical protein